ncbi:MAG TPA: hypothetical protein VFE24_05755 [Pirellulales bacterium]|jgi:hypothetical protein|nr:hypothetical protein [Pirellulales bacterium]
METGVLNQAWAVVLTEPPSAAIGLLRTTPGIEVCACDQRIWLRGAALEAALEQRLRGLPALQRYWVAADGALTAWGQRVPHGTLPRDGWRSLLEWCALDAPAAGWPAEIAAPLRLTLVPSYRERPAGALLIDWNVWAAYAETAPKVRLEGLAFALNERRQVMVRGETLPPVPGQRLVYEAGLLVPAGMCWQPAVEAAVVRAAFGLAEGECALWLTADRWERIAPDAWCKATRSAVRASAPEGDYVR